MSFGDCRLRKTWLDKCLKSCVSQDPSTDDMANGSKNCCNVNYSIFIMFINHSGPKYVRKVSFSDMQYPQIVF